MKNTPRTAAVCLGIAGIALGTFVVAGSAVAQPDKRAEAEPVRRDVQKRAYVPAERDLTNPDLIHAPQGGTPVYPLHFRTIDGSFNNPDHPEWGAAKEPMKRAMPAAYPVAPGTTPARASGPSVRAVSNALVAQSGSIENPINASDYLWQWGQFIDHDVVETPLASPSEALDIPVPMGDPFFDPMNTGTQVIGMSRSAYEIGTDGMRHQVNEITAYIDASMVYGSDEARADWLRVKDGSGKLKTTAGDLLPYNTDGFPNAPTGSDPTMFLAGDVRVNEQVGLAAMHTLFVREHNYWCDRLAIEHPGLTGDEYYERARAIVAAEMQAITYNEFLPLLIGNSAMPGYTGYKVSVDASIMNMFATAGYRVGHTMLSGTLMRLDATDMESSEGHIGLRDAFFTPSEIETNGIDSVLRGLSAQRAQNIDRFIVDDVRNFLFGPPGSGGFDLASLNMQRARDHGIPDYNSIRMAYGRPGIVSFNDVNPGDPSVGAALASVYSSVDEIDPWIGLLSEPQAPGALVGETLKRMLADQFTRLRDGDRFWYTEYLPTELVNEVNNTTLGMIIKRNTDIGDEMSDNVFIAQDPCPADVNNDGNLNFFDISMVIQGIGQSDPRVDYTDDGSYDFFDLSAFLTLYQSGCP
jgi:hypothetical protein